jgi:hypothetical protein
MRNQPDEVTIMAMPNTPAHAKPSGYDHAWVLVVVAAFALYDVWESWTQVGNKSGYAHGTGWTLTVIVEVFAAYCLFAWFDAPGRRSRQFAMWSAFAVLGLSLIGQGSSTLAAHATPPVWLAVFVKDLPVVVLALIALLVHVRRLDRAGAAQHLAAEEAVAADDRAALRAEMEALRAELETAQGSLAAAQDEIAQAAQDRANLARKLDAANRAKDRANARANTPRNGRANPRAKQEPSDVDARTKALKVLSDEPGISGRQLGPRVGMSERWGQLHRDELAAMAADLEGQT